MLFHDCDPTESVSEDGMGVCVCVFGGEPVCVPVCCLSNGIYNPEAMFVLV